MKSFYSFSYFTIFIIGFLLIGNSSNLVAQTDTLEQPSAENAIKDLKEGVLIVQLPSYRKKIAAMEDLLKDKSVSEGNKKNLRRQIKVTKEEARVRNQAIVAGFTEKYDFSDVLFIYDTATEAVQEGKVSGVFLDEDLKIDEEKSMGDRPFFFARFGTTDRTTTAGVEGLLITDKNLQTLSSPFPAYVREGNIKFLMDKIFDKKNADKRNMPRLVEKLNGNLKRYFFSVR